MSKYASFRQGGAVHPGREYELTRSLISGTECGSRRKHVWLWKTSDLLPWLLFNTQKLETSSTSEGVKKLQFPAAGSNVK